MLLTQRTPHLADHAGQISLPGGRIEPSDPDAHRRGAARGRGGDRPAAATMSRSIGRLDTYITGTGFEITPIVGLVRAAVRRCGSIRFEVAEIFEVPLDFILDPANHRAPLARAARPHAQLLSCCPIENRNIWGATAAMLVNLAEVLSVVRRRRR